MAFVTSTVLAVAALATAAAGTAVAVYGQQQQAKAAEYTADYNADVAEQQAAHESQVALENARRRAIEAGRIIGLQREAIAASGLAPVGTPLAVLGDSVMTLERDIMDMGYEAAARARQLQTDAAMGRWEGAATAGALRTASYGTALAGASRAAGGFLGSTGKIAPTTNTTA